MKTKTYLFRAAVILAVALAGCAEEGEGPPVFNAVDPSVQCPTGKIGWDFTTGGNDTDIVTQDVSREIKVMEATFGGSCGAPIGNYTTNFAIECDGKDECTRIVQAPGAPAVTCANRDFRIKYRCGDEPATYDVRLTADAANKEVTLLCGSAMTVISATYASNKTPPPFGNLTAKVAEQCTGKRRCSLDSAFVLLGSDPWENVAKKTEVRFVCGGEPQDTVRFFEDGERLDFYCPIKEKRSRPDEVIHVRAASMVYPVNYVVQSQRDNDERITNDLFNKAVTACQGKKTCEITPLKGAIDPAPLEMPDVFQAPRDGGISQVRRSRAVLQQVQIEYWCGAEQAPHFKRVVILNAGNASNPTPITIKCGQPPQVIDVVATGFIDPRTEVSAADAKVALLSQCTNNQRVCRVPDFYGNWRPRDGKKLQALRVKYTCGDLTSEVFEKDFNYSSSPSGSFEIECEPFRDNVFRGIRIKSASNGQIVPVTQQCFGKDQCIVNGLQQASTVEYRCGDAPELFTATNVRNNSLLNCVPAVTIQGVRNCAGEAMNIDVPVSSRENYTLRQLCGANAGECNLYSWAYAYVSCETVEVDYSCGADPKLYTKRLVGNRSPDRITANILKCQTPDTPYINKKCIDTQCRGKTRRDKDLACVPDPAMPVLTSVLAFPRIYDWTGDAGTQEAPIVTVLKEDVPYRAVSSVIFRKLDPAVPIPNVAATLWAYDQFAKKPVGGVVSPDAGVPSVLVPGMRCIVAEGTVTDAELQPSSVGASFRVARVGGKGGVIPPQCYRQDVVDDAKTAWTDAARRAGVTESVFRRDYYRVRTMLGSSFDTKGETLYSRSFLSANQVPFVLRVNPVGFFYDPSRQWIDLYSYYAQTSNASTHQQIEFQESTSIEIAAMTADLRDQDGMVSVQETDLLPEFGVDLQWYMRGDSPLKNPLSPNTVLTANAATNLSRRNLRASIEIARQDSTLANPWIVLNTVQFPSIPVPKGNAFSRTDRLIAVVTPEVRRRLLTVKTASGDGFMSDDLNDETAFKVRACLEFDGSTKAPGATDINNKFVTATRDGATYQVGITNRCSEAKPYILRRDLFVRPAYPVADKDVNADKGSGKNQGNSLIGTANDVGSQSSCGKACTTNADCTGMGTCVIPTTGTGLCSMSVPSAGGQACNQNDRSGMATSGSFGRSIYSTKSKSSANQSDTATSGNTTASAELLSYSVIDDREGQASVQRSTKKEFELVISPNFGEIAEIISKLRGVPGTKPWYKKKRAVPFLGKKGKSKTQGGREGLAIGISKTFITQVGPVPVMIEIGAAVGFGMKLTFKIATDTQTIANMNSPLYPCLKNGGTSCFVVETTAKNFTDANAECQFKGGRLAEIRTAAALTEVKAAIGANTASEFWIGAQLAYLYSAACNATEPKTTACANTSSTGYSWMTANTLWGKQSGTATALVTPSVYKPSHAFSDTAVAALRSLVPAKAAVVFQKANDTPKSVAQTEEKPFVCEYLPASKYIADTKSFEMEIEFSAGITGAICVPSTKVGFCLSAELKFLTAAFKIEVSSLKMNIFNNSLLLKTTVGNKGISGKWELAFLSGSLKAELRFFFGSNEWEIVKWDGVKKWEGTLFESVSPYRNVVIP